MSTIVNLDDIKRRTSPASDLAGPGVPDGDPMPNDQVRAWVAECARTRRSVAGAQLSQYDLSGLALALLDAARADLWRANLTDTDLTGANLADADARMAVLCGTRLVGVNLRGTDISEATFDERTDLTGAAWDERTRWPAGYRPAPSPVETGDGQP